MYTIAYFSPTGNTKYISNELKKILTSSKTQVIDIIKMDGENLDKNEHLIIMFSIHAFRAPKEVINFTKSIKKSTFNKISIIAVGCNNYWINDAASLKVRKILINKGYSIALDRVIAMPLTLVAKLPTQTCIEMVRKADIDLEEIANDLNSDIVDNRIVSLKSKLLANIGKIENYASRLFGLELYANKNCTSCGICWSSCPSKNIKNKNNKPQFGFKCSMCMRCIYKCPVKAINPRISKFIVLKDGYNVKNYTKLKTLKGDANNENS